MARAIALELVADLYFTADRSIVYIDLSTLSFTESSMYYELDSPSTMASLDLPQSTNTVEVCLIDS
jgi:hypothetical protein